MRSAWEYLALESLLSLRWFFIKKVVLSKKSEVEFNGVSVGGAELGENVDFVFSTNSTVHGSKSAVLSYIGCAREEFGLCLVLE